MSIRRAMQSVLLLFALAPFLMGQNAKTADDSVTAVTGESWLSHLHRSLSQTSMGSTGRLGPPAPMPRDASLRRMSSMALGYGAESVTLHGEDLYRMNCRGCHGETGQGAPPEINSLINPVRATSVPLIMERMKNVGMDITRSDASELARQSNASLLLRLHQGGESMPSFPQLSEAEIRSLVAYLKQLAAVPGAEREQVAVKETPVRIGEHIVKSTCHVCHGATGANPDPQQLLEGAIPPLSTLTTRVNRSELVRKVTMGAPINMGNPALPCRGRMPVFYYLTPDEVADVYLYLTLYPPNQATQVAEQEQLAATVGGENSPTDPPPSIGKTSGPAEVDPENDGDGVKAILSLSAAALLAFMLLAGGLWLTMREMKKLSGETAGRSAQPDPEPARVSALPVNVNAA